MMLIQSIHKRLVESRPAHNMHIAIAKLIFQSIWIIRIDLLQQSVSGGAFQDLVIHNDVRD